MIPHPAGAPRLIRLIGSDGTFEVHEAVDEAGSPRVVRRAVPLITRDRPRRAALESRAQDLMSVTHPLLVSVLDFVSEGEEAWIVEERIEGQPLSAVLGGLAARGGRVPPAVALHLGAQLCNALEGLHGQPAISTEDEYILHLAVRPDAVLLLSDGTFKLGGFGLFRSPIGGSGGGFPAPERVAYLSPEQTWPDQHLTPASDLFSLGVILFELVCGRPLFSDDSALQVVQAIRHAEVAEALKEANQRVPGLDRVLQRALSQNPRQRYQRAFVLREDLRGLMAGWSITSVVEELRSLVASVAPAPTAPPKPAMAALAGARPVPPSIVPLDSPDDDDDPLGLGTGAAEQDEADEEPSMLPAEEESSDEGEAGVSLAVGRVGAAGLALIEDRVAENAVSARDELPPHDAGVFEHEDLGAVEAGDDEEAPVAVGSEPEPVLDAGTEQVAPSEALPSQTPAASLDSAEQRVESAPDEASPVAPVATPPVVPAPEVPQVAAPPSQAPVVPPPVAPSVPSPAPRSEPAAPHEQKPPAKAAPPAADAKGAPVEPPRTPPRPVPPTPAPPSLASGSSGPPRTLTPGGPATTSRPPDLRAALKTNEPPPRRGPPMALVGGLVVGLGAICGIGLFVVAPRLGSTIDGGSAGEVAKVAHPSPPAAKAPVPSEPAPSEPAPAEPKPSEPATAQNVEPEKIEPEKVEPKVVEPEKPRPAATVASKPTQSATAAPPKPREPTVAETRTPATTTPAAKPTTTAKAAPATTAKATPTTASKAPEASTKPSSTAATAAKTAAKATPPKPSPLLDVESASLADAALDLPGDDGGGGLDLEGYAKEAGQGKLSSTSIMALETVESSDPQYTRSRVLLLTNAQKKSDSAAAKRYLDQIMSLPENQYNPLYLTEMARAQIRAGDYSKALANARKAEQYWARLPSDLVFTKKAEIYEIQAAATQGLFYKSGDNADLLDQSIALWERYRDHVQSRGRQDLTARADAELSKLTAFRDRME